MSDLPLDLSASIVAAIGFNSIAALLILPVNLKGTGCGKATTVTSPATDISDLVRRNIFGYLG